MTAQEAVNFQEALSARKENTIKYEQEAGKLTADDNQPDLIVSFRGKAVALAIIGDKSANAVARLLAELTRREDVFPRPAVKSRKKKEEDSGE